VLLLLKLLLLLLLLLCIAISALRARTSRKPGKGYEMGITHHLDLAELERCALCSI
jgi:hypothetical protein